MRCIQCEVAEKRFFCCLRPPDEIECPAGDVVDNETRAADEPAIVLHRGVVVAVPMSFGETIKGVEAAGLRVVGPLRAVMPLAEAAGGMAGIVEDVGQRAFRGIHPFLAERDAANATPRGIAAGEQFGTGGRADRLHEKL